MSFEPKTRLEKILCGVSGAAEKARTRIEKAVAIAIQNAGQSGSGLPDVTAEDNGDFLGVSSGKWTKVPAPSNAPYEVTATIDVDSGGNDRITLNVTAADAYAAFSDGRPMKMTGDVSGTTLESICYINSVKLTVESDVIYQFYYASNKSYASENLSASDNVVLTERTLS